MCVGFFSSFVVSSLIAMQYKNRYGKKKKQTELTFFFCVIKTRKLFGHKKNTTTKKIVLCVGKTDFARYKI